MPCLSRQLVGEIFISTIKISCIWEWSYEKNYILGLDIGITSVGYGVIDYKTRDVIDAGVRLFKEANVENNEGRRSKEVLEGLRDVVDIDYKG